MRSSSESVAPLLLSVREAAKALGISERKLWELTKSDEIPRIRVGRRVLYDPHDLRGWIDAQKKEIR